VVLLDTHAWIWTVEGDTRRIGRRARQLIARAETREAVRVSAASLFEIVALHTAGRLRLTLPPEQWVDASLDLPGVRLAELTRTVAVDAGFIPRTALADPLDRILVATARQLGATLLTADTTILEYGKDTGNVRVQELGR
jgi:PIN domain nuclease of toxin-antitoxin system